MFFRQQLKRGLVNPDGTKEASLCMDTYRYVGNPLVVTPQFNLRSQMDV